MMSLPGVNVNTAGVDDYAEITSGFPPLVADDRKRRVAARTVSQPGPLAKEGVTESAIHAAHPLHEHTGASKATAPVKALANSNPPGWTIQTVIYAVDGNPAGYVVQTVKIPANRSNSLTA